MYKLPAELLRNFFTSEFNIKPTSDGNEIRINSIYKSDSKFHCYINLNKGVYTDYKMSGLEEESGSVIKLLKNYLDVSSNKQVIYYLITNYGTFEQKEKIKEYKKPASDIIKTFLSEDKPVKVSESKGIFGDMVKKYLKDRKISDDYINKMMYVFNEDSRYDKRVIIPYFENERFVYFQARSLEKDAALRYINPIGADTKEFVFNIDNINDELIICEGVFDAMSMDEQVATCMCSGDLGKKQIEKIVKKKPSYIIYARDNDETGERTLEKNIKNLILYGYTNPIYLFDVPSNVKDLNEMKVKTGKNFILKRECELYNPGKFNNDWISKISI